MQKAAEESARVQKEILMEVQHEAQQAALEAAGEQVARHDQQLQELQRVAEEQRQQLDQAAQDQRLLEQQVVESRSVVEAAFEAADGRASLEGHAQPLTTPVSCATVTSDAPRAKGEALVVPSSATTVDVRGEHKGVTFDPIVQASSPTIISVRDRLAKLDWRSISAPAVVAIRAHVEKHLAGHADKLEAERMFFDVARKYLEHDLASGCGPPVSEAPKARQLPVI
ncbi:hypothetical protein CYMTET_15752 [Cymbomonas tetramitiformis]|uniref:Uncharacterized protein n=1 Tax=Cymbomonas tetramitiformis TaxID=36881 RepID=A0AAE0GDQ8_9CHLO|nr:hypothetical protein CYMTET_15752 [Cymbomonas tetramitiformis]